MIFLRESISIAVPLLAPFVAILMTRYVLRRSHSTFAKLCSIIFTVCFIIFLIGLVTLQNSFSEKMQWIWVGFGLVTMKMQLILLIMSLVIYIRRRKGIGKEDEWKDKVKEQFEDLDSRKNI